MSCGDRPSDVRVTDIADALSNANIYCSVNSNIENNPETSVHGGTLNQGNIFVLVDPVSFTDNMERYEKGAWTHGLNIDELLVVAEAEDLSTFHDVWPQMQSYANGMLYLTEILAHEAAHIVVGKHSDKTKKQIDELTNSDLDHTELAEELETIDEMYAWGSAASAAVSTAAGERARAYLNASLEEE